MNKKSLLFLAIPIFLFLLSACVTPTKEISEKQNRCADAAVEAFTQHGMEIVDDLCKENVVIITAAQQVFKTETGHQCNMQHDHHAHAEQGHPFTLVVAATPDKNGEFSQKILQLGDKKFFYKVLYTATIRENEITLSKTVATEGSPSRTEETVEQELLEDIAESIGGKVEGTKIALQ
ncbi:MAG: hypothetical protein KQH63_02030 [Desulfobulbaceae bacterium]|nr:hypothetical protein [Desulfobulbaceae bacterium]